MLTGLNSSSHDSIFAQSYATCLVCNLLNMTGIVYYFYLMFRGYGILPFIAKPQKFLLPIPFTLMVFSLLTLAKINTWNLLLQIVPI